jgi:hypothetical protein
LHPEFFLDSIRARTRRRNDIKVSLCWRRRRQTMKLWIRKRDIISIGIGSIVAVVIWVVLLGPTFH